MFASVGSAPLRTEILDPPAEDCAWQPQVRRLTVKPRARSSRVATCTYPRPFGQSAKGMQNMLEPQPIASLAPIEV